MAGSRMEPVFLGEAGDCRVGVPGGRSPGGWDTVRQVRQDKTSKTWKAQAWRCASEKHSPVAKTSSKDSSLDFHLSANTRGDPILQPKCPVPSLPKSPLPLRALPL